MNKLTCLILSVNIALLLGCGSSSDAKTSVDNLVDDTTDSANAAVEEQTQSLSEKVPTLDGNFTGKTVTSDSTSELDVVVEISGSSLKFDLSDGTNNFPISGTILVAASSSGKKLLSSGKIDVDYKIDTSSYGWFQVGATIKGILELDGDDLKIDFNWDGSTRPTNFGDSNWACTANRQ
ncbi:MAG: hypothetical protein COA79_02225 [Planctomycetota bacterium]|nr:MAG: hypothetical protein COA79_02225 [Planctomycetota bacterium]